MLSALTRETTETGANRGDRMMYVGVLATEQLIAISAMLWCNLRLLASLCPFDGCQVRNLFLWILSATLVMTLTYSRHGYSHLFLQLSLLVLLYNHLLNSLSRIPNHPTFRATCSTMSSSQAAAGRPTHKSLNVQSGRPMFSALMTNASCNDTVSANTLYSRALVFLYDHLLNLLGCFVDVSIFCGT